MANKLITFDVTNTLIRVSSSVGAQYNRMGIKLVHKPTYRYMQFKFRVIIENRFNMNLNANEIDKNFKIVFKEQNILYPSYGYHTSMIEHTLVTKKKFIYFIRCFKK